MEKPWHKWPCLKPPLVLNGCSNFVRWTPDFFSLSEVRHLKTSFEWQQPILLYRTKHTAAYVNPQLQQQQSTELRCGVERCWKYSHIHKFGQQSCVYTRVCFFSDGGVMAKLTSVTPSPHTLIPTFPFPSLLVVIFTILFPLLLPLVSLSPHFSFLIIFPLISPLPFLCLSFLFPHCFPYLPPVHKFRHHLECRNSTKLTANSWPELYASDSQIWHHKPCMYKDIIMYIYYIEGYSSLMYDSFEKVVHKCRHVTEWNTRTRDLYNKSEQTLRGTLWWPKVPLT